MGLFGSEVKKKSGLSLSLPRIQIDQKRIDNVTISFAKSAIKFLPMALDEISEEFRGDPNLLLYKKPGNKAHALTAPSNFFLFLFNK